MNILADENIPRLIVDCLRDQGHDVYWVAESNPAIKDQQVLKLAIHSERLRIPVNAATLPIQCSHLIGAKRRISFMGS